MHKYDTVYVKFITTFNEGCLYDDTPPTTIATLLVAVTERIVLHVTNNEHTMSYITENIDECDSYKREILGWCGQCNVR